ncbi:hypothetical protein RYH80_17725 [Halobaculum sp. MBLA0147]|uniref:hypothetical protein n=1 Tax=Halobaculum sp. MBLA0147 TaxID=3079934 RepID=UPI0035253167
MNHVPDEAVAALDAFGRGILEGDPPPVRERLRSDLRVRIVPGERGRASEAVSSGSREPASETDEPASAAATARCRFLTEHTQTPATLRGRGSYVTTIVDAIDERLVAWGVRPPGEYRYVESRGETHVYEGTLELP